MAQIRAEHVTFYYGGSHQEIFKDMSFVIDSDWKLGLVGRNGRGKTTLLRLLLGEEEFEGRILSSQEFLYFPFPVDRKSERLTYEVAEEILPDHEFWKLCRELNYLEMDGELLYRPFSTLSQGEQTRILLALLFLKEDHFLLIDEPTNHLDRKGREVVSRYLNKKKGFILVSHDRAFLDGCIDHVMSINRQDIQVVQGNFSSWWENKERQDAWEISENEKRKKEISRLAEAARRAEDWSGKVEKTKFGTKVGGLKPDRGAIGHKAAKMMKRAKSTERRMEAAAEEKRKLLKNIEVADQLKLFPLEHHKEELIVFRNVSLSYGEKEICSQVNFSLRKGEKMAISGGNGCGKSTILKAISGEDTGGLFVSEGEICLAPGLLISCVPQDASFLKGSLDDYMESCQVDKTLMRTLLRKLDFSREHFEKPMEDYSEGQRKKVLLAGSMAKRAHLYIWDEPMNYIDVFSRMQIETLLEESALTLLFVEHDQAFSRKIATKEYRI